PSYMENFNKLQELQLELFAKSPLLGALTSNALPHTGIADLLLAAAPAANTEGQPNILLSALTNGDDMALTSEQSMTDMTRLVLQLLQQQAAATAVSTAASMPNLLNIGNFPFTLPTTVPSSFSFLSSSIPTTTALDTQGFSLMRPRVNSAASSSTSSSSLSSPNPTSSPERRRKRARSLLIKADEAAAKIDKDSKLKRSDALAELIEDEQQRREIAASVMAASANGTLTTLKSSSPTTKGLIDEFPKITLRPLINESTLPESVGPDSPYRHHPKYQKKNADAATDFMMGQSFASFALNKDKKTGEDASSTSSSMSSLAGNPEALKMMLSKFMDDVISGELVASN
ncbi:hypothetical protein PFISCL1PPCAC_1549, partial [Pristionchus fissidentatus]